MGAGWYVYKTNEYYFEYELADDIDMAMAECFQKRASLAVIKSQDVQTFLSFISDQQLGEKKV